jgi:hypothetical protein
MTFRIETDVPYGNACDVSIVEGQGVTEVSFAPDPHGGPECLWFCFRLTNDQEEPAKVRLVLKHAYNMLGGQTPQNMRPVVRYAGEDWVRLGGGTVEELPDGRYLVIWMIDAPRSYVDVAYCYPYGQNDVDALLRDTDGYWRADTIGLSQGSRPLVRLSNDYGGRGDNCLGLYLIARQHSGETTGSWLLDGFLRHVASLLEFSINITGNSQVIHMSRVTRAGTGQSQLHSLRF